MISTRKTIHFLLLIMLLLTGVSVTYGSEVTGTLSGGGNTSQVGGPLGSDIGGGGQIAGTVTGGSGSSGSGSGGSSSGGRSGGSSGSSGGNSNQSDGQVLGASADAATSPLFPNAGTFPGDSEEGAKSFAGVITTATILLGLVLLGSVFLKRRTNE